MDDWKTIVSFSDGLKASDMSVSKSADCQLEIKIAGRHWLWQTKSALPVWKLNEPKLEMELIIADQWRIKRVYTS